jgi:hypothetical protein
MNSKPDSMPMPLRRRIGPALLTLLAALALALTVPARAGTQPPAIPFSEIGVRATANYQGDALGITTTVDGARLRCGFQKLEGYSTTQGLWLESTKPGAAGCLRVVAQAVGRAVPCAPSPTEVSSSRSGGAQGTARPTVRFPNTGEVSVADKLVRFTRPGLTEEYSVSVDGVRQDFIIESPPLAPHPSPLNPSAGDLRVELALSGARAEPTGSGARLSLDGSGRTLAYSRLRVEDALGRELMARLEVLSPDRLAVVVADASATYPVRIDPTFSDADWVSLGSGMGGYGSSAVVYTVAVSGPELYVGGAFTYAGGVWANNIAKWDGRVWSALNWGTSAEVFALAVSGTDLYAGGGFATAGGVSAANIAKWDGSAWSALGSGLGGRVRALAVSGTDLFAGGEFSTAGGVPAQHIAKWDGSSWSALGSGMNSIVYALAVSGTNLYAGGSFTTAGGVTINGIAQWNGSGWSTLGSGMSGAGSVVEALAVSGTDLYAGGYFTYAGGTGAMYIAKWDGNTWSPLGSGVNTSVTSLAVNGIDLYAGGLFTKAGELPASSIAKWNGWSWSALGSGLGGSSYLNAQALAADGAGHLFVGGDFTRAGTNSCPYVAQANVGLSAPTVPVIVIPPTNQNTLIGNAAEFSVVAWSTTPMGYQWFFGTTNLVGTTNTVLHLTNVQPWQAGVYAVVVTNVYGATTSAPVSLAVFPPGTVTDPTEPALRAAMAAGGTVTFACDGTITLAAPITNESNTLLDGSGHQVTISGDRRVGVFVVPTNVSFTVANLKITDGFSLGGSAILNLGGSVELTGVSFRSNSATLMGVTNLTASGGAIWNRGGRVQATDCSFTGNTARTLYGQPPLNAAACGGAIRNEAGEVDLRSCAFVNNRAAGGGAYFPDSSPNPGQGGAIYNEGNLTVDLCTFAGNAAIGGDGAAGRSPLLEGHRGAWAWGGAICCSMGVMTVDRTTFSGNTAQGGSGGSGASGDVFGYPNGSLGGNGAPAYGGAICGYGSISRSLFVSNTVYGGAGGGGGSGYQHNDMGGNGARGGDGDSGSAGAFSGGGTIVNCTLAFNTGRGGCGGGGGWGYGYVAGSQGTGGAGGNGGSGTGAVDGANLVNCTLVRNVGQAGPGGQGGSGYGGIGASGTSGNAYAGTGSGFANTLIASNTPAGGDSFSDPKLGPLADNGGPTLTMALLPGSPAIDAGNTTLAPATDQRGFPRPAGVAADIGAFEYGSVMPTLAISRSGATGLSILGSGNAGQSCRLLMSMDLASWVPIATNQFGTAGTVLFSDTYAPGQACRFYRLVMP